MSSIEFAELGSRSHHWAATIVTVVCVWHGFPHDCTLSEVPAYVEPMEDKPMDEDVTPKPYVYCV